MAHDGVCITIAEMRAGGTHSAMRHAAVPHALVGCMSDDRPYPSMRGFVTPEGGDAGLDDPRGY